MSYNVKKCKKEGVCLASELNNEVQIMQENLCDLRKIAGWTAENLATKLGTTKQTISNIENQSSRSSLTRR